LTIVIGGKFETLDLIAPSKEIRDNWVIGLKQIKRVLGEADLATQEEMYPCLSLFIFDCSLTLLTIRN
jgi:hypothetical protein